MKVFVSLSLVFAAAMSSFAGTLCGTVKAQPKPELAETSSGGGKYDSRQFKFIEKIKYDQIKDFIVYLEGAMTNVTFATPSKEVVTEKVTQKDAMFHPHVMPVVVGTEVRWPNKDDIFHNVFSISDAKNFDLGLYKDPEVGKVTFDKAGRVDVFCSIHSQMNCVILVLQNPFFAATDSKGAYRITNIPAGTYKVKAWHERLPGQVKEITIPDEGEVHEDFVVGVANLTR
jgi:plastocyanin